MFIFGTIGIFRRYIPLPSSLLAGVRGLVGMLFLLLVIALKNQKIDWAAVRKNFVILLASSVAMGFNWIFLFEAYNYTTVATATLCYYMQPIIVVLVSPILFREKLTAKKAVCVAVALIGMVLVSGVADSGFGGAGQMRGILLGLAAAVLYATVVILNKFLREITPYDKTILQLGIAAAVMLPYSFLTGDMSALTVTPTAIVMLLVVGVLHTGVTYAFYFGAIGYLKAQTVALYSYIDPVVAVLLSALLLREPISPFGIMGAVLVLGATLVSEWPERK